MKSKTITIMQSFVLPEGPCEWLDLWVEATRNVRSHPGCQAVRLMRDHHQPDHFVIVGDWDSPESYADFIRESGIMWMERASPFASSFTLLEPVEELRLTDLEPVPDEAGTVAVRERALTAVC